MFPLQRNVRTPRHHKICLPYTVTVAKSEVAGGDVGSRGDYDQCIVLEHRLYNFFEPYKETTLASLREVLRKRQPVSDWNGDRLTYFLMLLVEAVAIQREWIIFQVAHNDRELLEAAS